MGCPPGIAALRAAAAGSDKWSVFALAKESRSPLGAVETALPRDLGDAISVVSSMQERVCEFRRQRMSEFEEHAKLLEGYASRLRALQSRHVAAAAGSAHVALYAAVIDGLQWPHVRFARDHGVRGFDVIGRVPDTGVWRLRSAEEMRRVEANHVPPSELLATNAHWTRRCIVLCESAWGAAVEKGDVEYIEMMTAAFEASIAEVESKGTSRGPFTVDQVDAEFGGRGRWRPARRHAVWQGKWRPCDNMTGNKTNKAYLSREAVVMAGPTTQVAIARRFVACAERDGWMDRCELGGGAEDEPDAYRYSATSSPSLTVCMMVDPGSGKAVCFIPNGHNFGLTAAIVNYCSKPELLCATARRLFAVPAEHIVDDYVFVEPRFALGARLHGPARGGERFPQSAQGTMCRMMMIFGCAFAVKKHVSWDPMSAFCGTVSDFRRLLSEGVVELSVKRSTVEKVQRMVAAARKADNLSPSQAASLRGKLQWVWLYAKVGRARLRALAARQYSQREESEGGDGWQLDAELLELFDYVDAFLGGAVPSVLYRVHGCDEPPVVVLSDARWAPVVGDHLGEGRVGWITWVPDEHGGGVMRHASAAPSRGYLQRLFDLRAQKTLVCPLEEVGIASPYLNDEFARDVAGWQVVHLADNKAANSGAVRAYSRAADLAKVVSAMHDRWSQLRITPWIEFVKSEANAADLPSRELFGELVALGSEEVELDFPPLD